jgi:hypothetical protein
MVLNSRNKSVKSVNLCCCGHSETWVLRFPSNVYQQIFIQTNFLRLFNISCEQCSCSPIFSTPDVLSTVSRGCQGTRPLNIFHLKTVKLEIMDLKVNLILKYNVYKWLRVYSFTASPSTSFYTVNAVNYNNQCIIIFLVSPRIFFNCAHF